jgi:hypothetical protein
MKKGKKMRINYVVTLIKSTFLAVSAITIMSATASAVSIDFTDGTYGTSAGAQTYTEDGYKFQTPVGNHFDSVPSNGYLYFHDGPANAVFNNTVTLSFGGAAFNFVSVNLHGGNNAVLTVASSAGQTTSIGSASGPYNFNWQNITSVTFDITNFGNAVLDAVQVSTASPVPEPGTWMLMGTGLVGLLGYGWRKRQQQQV